MQSDLLIIGTGISALSLVFHLNEANFNKKIIIVSDDYFQFSNSYKSQGGIAFEKGNRLKKSIHIDDTVKCGIINNKENTTQILNEAEYSLENLIRKGLIFDKDKKGRLLKRKEAGHTSRRILFHSDTSGKFIQEFLFNKILKFDNVKLSTGKFCYELIYEDLECKGARFIDKNTNITETIFASKTIIATGGSGGLYKFTSNSTNAIGSGVALANDIGASISNMEFIQFHPTVYINKNETLLLSEALRGEGAKLVSDKDGILEGLELLTRDKLSRILYNYIRNGHNLFLDCSDISEEVIRKFDYILNRLHTYGIDLSKDLLPIQPAAHYMCGGITTNTDGQTTIRNLYAIGETADTGLHGANRLASNSLTEAITVPYLLAKKLIVHDFPETKNLNRESTKKKCLAIDYSNKIKLLQEKMWDNCGIVRNNTQLNLFIEFIKSEQSEIERLQNNGYSYQYYRTMLKVCKLIAESSLKQEKNVGTFWKQFSKDNH